MSEIFPTVITWHNFWVLCGMLAGYRYGMAIVCSKEQHSYRTLKVCYGKKSNETWSINYSNFFMMLQKTVHREKLFIRASNCFRYPFFFPFISIICMKNAMYKCMVTKSLIILKGFLCFTVKILHFHPRKTLEKQLHGKTVFPPAMEIIYFRGSLT